MLTRSDVIILEDYNAWNSMPSLSQGSVKLTFYLLYNIYGTLKVTQFRLLDNLLLR